MIDIGDDQVGDFGCQTLALAHAIADHLAAAEGDLVTIGRVVFLDLDDQFRVGKPHAVALGRAVEIGVVLPCDLCHLDFSSLPMTKALNP